MFNIAIAFDNQQNIALVLIKNIIDKSVKKELCFHIFIDQKTDFEWHEKLLKSWKVIFSIYRINEEDLGGMYIDRVHYTHITNASFYRLLMPSILNNLQCFLYIDTDTYINCDIREIFDYCSSTHALTVASEREGFNAGVLLINPKNFLHELPIEKSIELFNQHKFISDNELLVYFFRNPATLPIHFNYPAHSVTKKNNSLKIIHFMGTTKPWRYSTNLKFTKEWRSIHIAIFGKNPWDKITIKERILRITYMISPSPKLLYSLVSRFKNYLK